MSGQIVASLLSLCMAKWLRKWRWGWLYVCSNTKHAKSLMSRGQTNTVSLYVSKYFGTDQGPNSGLVGQIGHAGRHLRTPYKLTLKLISFKCFQSCTLYSTFRDFWFLFKGYNTAHRSQVLRVVFPPRKVKWYTLIPRYCCNIYCLLTPISQVSIFSL